MKQYKIEELKEQTRIDAYLNELLDMSRSKVQALLKEEKIKVNGNPSKASYSLKIDDVITVEEEEAEKLEFLPEKMNLDIVYEDDDVLVVNKANGVVVHPAVGNPTGTLVNGLMYHSKQLSTLNGEFRPGIVHRIDAYTTGLLMVAKNDRSHEKLAEQLEQKTTTRKYIALVWGVLKSDTATIEAPIGRDSNDRKKMTVTGFNSKEAVTHVKVLERFKKATLIELQLETGRTHQIRVHMNYIGHPIVNDPVYGKRKILDDTGQCLHAKTLGFVHPTTGEYKEFTSEIPEAFVSLVEQVKELS